jgi:hypothetical protein
MVFPSLKGLGQARRNNTDSVASHCVRDNHESAFRHAKGHETLLARMLTVMLPIEGKRVIEGFASALERDAMLGVILGGFGVIPLEIVICNIRTA